MRQIDDRKILIASHNSGKVSEINNLLLELGLETCSAIDLGLIEPEETGKTFVENSELKASTASKASALMALADDSGLVVPTLGGAPGIYSARWAIDGSGKNRGFTYAIEKIEAQIKSKGLRPEGQAAHFVCALSLAWPDGRVASCQGFAHGTLTFPPRGNKGFGYDPIFIPTNFAVTYGEMDPEEKHLISHRFEAFTKLSKKYFN